MFALPRQAVRATGKARAVCSKAQFTTASAKRGAAESSHGSEHGHRSASADEPLGAQVYFILAVIPACYITYHLSRPNKDGSAPGFTRLIDSYSYIQDQFKATNTLHTAMVEQAAFDRNLFQSDKGSTHVNLRFPEIMNTGSPYNVSAGQTADITKLVAHYEKLNADAEEKKEKVLAARVAATSV